jgi:hypothetical protein
LPREIRFRLASVGDELLERVRGYRVYEAPTHLYERKYHLDAIVTVPAIMEVYDGDGKVVRAEKVLKNYMLKLGKFYQPDGTPVWNVGGEFVDGEVSAPEPQLSPELIDLLAHHALEAEKRERLASMVPNPAEVYREVRAILDRYIEADGDTLSVLALYVVATYFYRMFDAFPYLYVFGPRQSGKTKLLTLMSRLCFHAVSTVNISTSALFRVIDGLGSTLVVDESDYLGDAEGKSEMQKLLWSGYKRALSNVMRTEGEERKYVKHFNIFGPKVFASINYPNDVMLDRCIIINLIRGSSEKVNLEPRETFQDLRDKLYLTLFYYFDEIYNLRGKDDFENPLLVARERELWRPLLVVAAWLGGYLGSEEASALWGSINSVIAADVERKVMLRIDSDLNTLLYALRKIVVSGYVPLELVRSHILDIYRHDSDLFNQAKKTWTPTKIGRMMASLGFRRQRRSDGTYYYVDTEQVAKLCESYNVDVEEGEAQQPSSIWQEGDDGDGGED